MLMGLLLLCVAVLCIVHYSNDNNMSILAVCVVILELCSQRKDGDVFSLTVGENV